MSTWELAPCPFGCGKQHYRLRRRASREAAQVHISAGTETPERFREAREASLGLPAAHRVTPEPAR